MASWALHGGQPPVTTVSSDWSQQLRISFKLHQLGPVSLLYRLKHQEVRKFHLCPQEAYNTVGGQYIQAKA